MRMSLTCRINFPERRRGQLIKARATGQPIQLPPDPEPNEGGAAQRGDSPTTASKPRDADPKKPAAYSHGHRQPAGREQRRVDHAMVRAGSILRGMVAGL